MKELLKVFMIIGIFVCLSTQAFAVVKEQTRTEGSGKATIVNGDLVQARTNALENSRANAVLSVIPLLIPENKINENIDLIEKEILSRGVSFICGETIVDESWDDENYYLKIDACVLLNYLDSQLVKFGIKKGMHQIPRGYVVYANNVRNFKTVDQLSDLVKQFRGVTNVERVSYENKQAVFRVYFKGSAAALAEGFINSDYEVESFDDDLGKIIIKL